MTENSRYSLAKKIARGGMAEIYLGKQIGEDGFQRLCAIKRILPHFAQDHEFIEMFRDEAHICKRLQHANIVKVEGFEEVEGSYAIIMEYVNGADLRTFLASCEKAKARLTVPMSVFIIAEASRGLHYAHTKIDEITGKPLGVVHRDISPQNILISFEGEVKVTDFGIADAESKITETKPGIVKGKYSYMSPEQITAKTLDARTDIFSLAIVLFEMLTMKRLFQGENEIQTIQVVKNCKIPTNMAQFNPEIDLELEGIMTRALQRDLKKRYQTAADFEKDLRRFLSKKYPDFTASDLGAFLKSILDTKLNENQAEIKRILTSTSLKPKADSKAPKKLSSSTQQVIEFNENDAAASINISLMGQKMGFGSRQSQSPGKNSNPSNPSASGQLAMNNNPFAANVGGNISLSGSGPFKSSNFGVAALSRPSSQNSVPLSHGALALKRGRTSGNHKLAISSVIILILTIVAGGFFFQYQEQRALKPIQVTIASSPSNVLLNLDGRKISGGKYNKTPYILEVPPGNHVISIQRAGYRKEFFHFRANPGESIDKKDIVLVAPEKFAPTKIVSTTKKTVYVEINDKFDYGFLPKAATDLQNGKPYKMKVYPNYQQNKADFFNCRFNPKADSWRNPFMVVVDTKARKCK